MASGLFFDPIHLLHVAPLASSTGTIAYAIGEYISNTALTRPEIRTQSDQILPKLFSEVFNRGVWVVLGFNLTTISTSLATILLERGAATPSVNTKLYTAGLAAAIGHLIFVPFVAPPVQRIVENRSEGGATQDMKKWLGFHRLRLMLADLPAWLSFIAAVASAGA